VSCLVGVMPRVTVCTAYTTNYALGRLCEDVNRRYCQRHGYRFVCEVLSAGEMQDAIDPRTCFSWYKVLMMNRLLDEELAHEGRPEDASYLLWVDADAVVVRQDRTVESIIGMGPDADLIAGEDLSAACRINAGVLLVRASEWSHTLFRDMWARKSRFQRARYFEQSELLKQLSFRNEGLELVEPFHSYKNGPVLKRFPHVLVLPREEFNSNRGVVLPSSHTTAAATHPGRIYDGPLLGDQHGEQPGEEVGAAACDRLARSPADDCRFIFHAVGSWNKWAAVCAMLQVLCWCCLESHFAHLYEDFKARPGSRFPSRCMIIR
jgi:hypothetical protein